MAEASVDDLTGEENLDGEEQEQSSELGDGDESTESSGSVDEESNDSDKKDDSDGESKDSPSDESKNEPIEYADFSMPEGMSLDEGALSDALPLFQELGLEQGQAQKVIDVYSGLLTKQANEFQETVDGWAKATKDHKEFGGEKLEESLSISKRGIDKFATEGFAQLLDDYGLGNHPDVVETFIKIGLTVKEDGPEGGNPIVGEMSRTQKLYGNN